MPVARTNQRKNLLPNLLQYLFIFPVVAGTALCASTRLAAQGADAEMEAIEEFEVEVRAEAGNSTTPQTVIDEAAIRGDLSAASVDGLLENTAGVDFTRRDAGGSQNSKLRLRGMNERRLLILLNGRRLNGFGVCGQYFVDWTSLSIENIERIEIYRGAAPVKYGNNLGGAVNIITSEGSKDYRGFFRMVGGSNNTWSVQLSQSWGAGPVLFNIYARHHETKGYLRNAFSQKEAIGGGLTFLLPQKFKLRTAARYSYNQSGMPVYNMPDSPYYDKHLPDSLDAPLGGPGVNPIDHGAGSWGPLDWGDGTDGRDHRAHFDIALSRTTEAFDIDVSAWLMEQRRKDRFYAVDDSRHLILRRKTAPENHNWGWQLGLKNRFDLAGSHTVEYGGEGTYLGMGDITIEHIDENYFSQRQIPAEAEGKRNIIMHHGFYLSDLWEIHRRLSLDLGLRFDTFRAAGSDVGIFDTGNEVEDIKDRTLGPRVAVSVRTWPGGKIEARYRNAHRFPVFPEYYWWFLGYQAEGRKDLAAENAHQVDLEVKHVFTDTTSLVARGYYYAVEDYIRMIGGYRPGKAVYNVDKVHFAGLELEGTFKLPHHFYTWANYTYQKTKKSGDALDMSTALSHELVELPKHKFNFEFGYSDPKGLQAQFTLRFVGVRHSIEGNLATEGGSTMEQLDSFWKLDARASYPIIQQAETDRSLRLEVSFDNILNQEYSENFGYPMPGLGFMAGMRATL
jgi:iron complex outermembrane recepter protein